MAQARAALKQYKDVMQAAERFFEGKFDHIKDEDVEMSSGAAENKTSGLAVGFRYYTFPCDSIFI